MQSKPMTDTGDVKLVPIPGHSIAQVAVVVSTDGPRLFFAPSHVDDRVGTTVLMGIAAIALLVTGAG
jgi:hypothetical protein